MVFTEGMIALAASAANETSNLAQNVEAALQPFFPDSQIPFLAAHFGVPAVALGITFITRQAMRHMGLGRLSGIIGQNSGEDPTERANKTEAVAVIREIKESNPQFPLSSAYVRPKLAERIRAWRHQQKLGRH